MIQAGVTNIRKEHFYFCKKKQAHSQYLWGTSLEYLEFIIHCILVYLLGNSIRTDDISGVIEESSNSAELK